MASFRLSLLSLLLVLLAAFYPLETRVSGQDKPAGETTPAAEEPSPGEREDTLASRQELVKRRYERFVQTLRKVSESLKKADPERSALLLRAVGKSNEFGIETQMGRLVQLLKEKDPALGDALESQTELVTELQMLLDLLLSEDRAKELAEEKKRLEQYLKDLNKLIAQEKDVRAATERGEPGEGLADRQKKISDKTQELGKNIDRDDKAKRAKAGEQNDSQNGNPQENQSQEGKPQEGKPGEQKPGEEKPGEEKAPGEKKPNEGKPGEQKPGEQKPGEQKPGEEKKPNEGKPGESQQGKPQQGKPQEGKPQEGKPQQGQPQEGKPQEGQPQEGQPQDQQQQNQQQQPQQTPGRENLEKARQEMERAIEKLKKEQERRDASDHQDEAIRELVKAKEKLEEILRQLREEEKERMLAALEARFQRMLAMQLIVYEGTLKLGRVPAADRERYHSQARQLSQQEGDIALDATKTITLLREEGTAVALPEAVEQMRDDMQLVTQYLQDNNVGELTQAIEKDIIDALQEIIEALQKEMEKQDEKKKQQQQQQQQQQEQDKALVDQLAELKMLRSLQLRINHRTKRLGRLVEGEQADQPDVLSQLRNLAERQSRIQEATYNLATGKNK